MQNVKVTTLSHESIEQFRNSLSELGSAQNTIKGYTTDLRMLLLETEGDLIELEDLKAVGTYWLNSRRDELAPKTTGRRLVSLKAFATWAGMPNLFHGYKAPTPGKSIPHPLPEGPTGIRLLIEHCNQDKHRALIALCGFMGLRISEANAAAEDQFDTHEMVLTVRGKGDKTRYVPISPEAWEHLMGPVLMSRINRTSLVVGMPDRFSRQLITNLGKRAGLQRAISSHDLRATFATAVYDSTLDVRVVQELLGHSDSKTTEGYILRDLKTLREAVVL